MSPLLPVSCSPLIVVLWSVVRIAALDYLMASLLSTRAESDLCKLNPFLTPETVQSLLTMLAGALFRFCRVVSPRPCSL